MSAATLEREPGVYPVTNELGQDEDWEVVPAHTGPTWERDPDWTGPTDPDGYILPRWTLGWQVIDWIEKNLLADETDENDQPLPFALTREQMRFILWFYAVNEYGHFIYREIVL